MTEPIIFETNNLHYADGTISPGRVKVVPREGLVLNPGEEPNFKLDKKWHIAPGRIDTHVHFRQSYIPSRKEFEKYSKYNKGLSYGDLVEAIGISDKGYDVRRGTLAALKGGVWLVGCMGNTPWAPLGKDRWEKTQGFYQKVSSIFTHVFPRMEPGFEPIEGQEEKDFAATFGGSGLSDSVRRILYLAREGGMVSYHNDDNRENISLIKFIRENPDIDAHMVHHRYYNGKTVLDMQRKTINLAKEARLSTLTTRHIPTGPGLQMIIDEREEGLQLNAEIGLDYLYWNRDMLENSETRMINYRRPALPSEEDQKSLIEITLDQIEKKDTQIFIGSDHAPHTLEAKAFKDGLPGSPGTRILELSHQIHANLVHNHEYTWQDIDILTAINPAKYMAQFMDLPFPIGKIDNGNMANLTIFDPSTPFKLDEAKMKRELEDEHYHSAYKNEKLQGKIHFTVVDGTVYDVTGDILTLN